MKRTTRMGRTRQRNRRQRKTRKKENCSPPPPVCCAWNRRRRPWPGEPGDPPPVSALRDRRQKGGRHVCASVSVLRCVVPHPYNPFTKCMFARTVAGIPGNLTVVNLGRRFPRKERREEPWEIHLGRGRFAWCEFHVSARIYSYLIVEHFTSNSTEPWEKNSPHRGGTGGTKGTPTHCEPRGRCLRA